MEPLLDPSWPQSCRRQGAGGKGQGCAARLEGGLFGLGLGDVGDDGGLIQVVQDVAALAQRKRAPRVRAPAGRPRAQTALPWPPTPPPPPPEASPMTSAGPATSSCAGGRRQGIGLSSVRSKALYQ